MSGVREKIRERLSPQAHQPPSWCEICSLPRPQSAEAWQDYQRARLQHTRSLATPDEVVAHETARRRWLGESQDRMAINVRCDLDRWHTERYLDSLKTSSGDR